MDPFKLNFTASSVQWSKGFLTFLQNEPDDGYNEKIGSFSTVYHTAYLRNEPGDPQFLMHFWHKVPII